MEALSVARETVSGSSARPKRTERLAGLVLWSGSEAAGRAPLVHSNQEEASSWLANATLGARMGSSNCSARGPGPASPSGFPRAITCGPLSSSNAGTPPVAEP